MDVNCKMHLQQKYVRSPWPSMLQYIGSEASGNLHPRNGLQTTTPMLASPTSDPVASHKTPAPHGFRHARGMGSARELEGAGCSGGD
jgi:hypothetical protein